MDRARDGVGDLVLEDEALLVGTAVHRYVVIERVGIDASASIYAAYDPNLDRKVALKLLSGTLAQEHESASLLAEAQSLARLTHPNVVRVHDVGTFEGKVFVAREFVEGRSLLRWMREAPRSPTQVRHALALAGRGLAAAHEAGIVHGGIRPRSVLVGDDGSVRVTDFGVGAGVEETSPYRAPEVRRGAPTSARSDQFAFCLMVLESISNHPASELAPDGEPRWERIREASRKVPRKILAALETGLALDPAARHASVLSIVRQLEPKRRSRRAIVALGVCSAAALAVFASSTKHSAYCDDVAGRLDGIWDGSRRRDIRQAFERTQQPYASDAFTAIASRLDDMAAAWIEAQTTACFEATQSEDDLQLVARRMYCLERRLDDLRAVTHVFEEADSDVVRRALELVHGMRPVSLCDGFSEKVPGEDEREAVATIEAGLAQVQALRVAGRVQDAISIADRLVKEAESIGYAPIEVSTLATRAMIEQPKRDPQGEDRLHHAFSKALAVGDRELLGQLAHAIASWAAEERRFVEAERWLDYAEALMVGANIPLNQPGPAAIAHLRGRMASLQARYADAVRHYADALDRRIEALGPHHERLAIYRVNLGQAYQDDGQYADADREYRLALDLQRGSMGEHHPIVAQTHLAVAGLLSVMGRAEEALDHAQRGRDVLVAIHGEEHPLVGDACVYVSGALSLLDRETEALEQLDRALAAYRATAGDRSYRAAIAYANIAAIRVTLDEAKVADEFFQQAIERMREVLGDDHVAVFLQRGNRLTALLELGRLDEAETEATIVIDAIAQRLGSDHPAASYAHEALAEVHARRGRHDAAVGMLERALELRSGRGELEQAHTEVLLAQAWRRNGQARERADVLEAEARAQLEAGGPTGRQRLRALERAFNRIERASR